MLARVFGCCRYVYNEALRLRSEAWKERKERIGYKQTSALLPKWKRDEKTEWLKEVSSVALQQSLRHLDAAYQRFFKGLGGYPDFKKRSHRQAACFMKSAFKYVVSDPKNPSLSVSGLGRLKVRWSRDFGTKQPSSVTIVREASGKYFVSIVVEETFAKLPRTYQSVGIDLGINCLAALSDGTRIENPKHTNENQVRLAKAQRVLSRRVKGSGRWRRQRAKVARVHERIGNSRKDHLDKVTTEMVRKFDRISMEDLNVKGMVKNRKLSKSISDVSFGMIRRMLGYKCERYGRELVLIDRFYPSSKTCSSCGHKLNELPLKVREWTCPDCGAVHDRDANAAQNILAEGHSVTARGGRVRRPKISLGSLGCGGRRNVNHLVSCA